jgi:hypothetical protein
MPSLVSSIIQLIQSTQDAAAPLEKDAEPTGQPANPDIDRPSAESGQGVVSAVEPSTRGWVN